MRTLITGALLALTSSCGSSSSNEAAQDAGTDAALDAGDATVDAPADAPDASAPVGKKLATGLLHGVTSDDFAIVDDGTSLRAAPLDGGAVQTFAPLGATPIAFAVSHKMALAVGKPLGGSTPEFWVWTSAHGAVKLASSPTWFEQYVDAVSPDDTHVVYVTNGGMGTGDVTVANLDGTGVTTLLAGVGAQGMQWAGDHYLLVLRANGADSGPPSFTLSVFDANAAWAKVDLSTDVAGLGATTHGSSIAVRDSGGTLRAYPLSGGAPTVLDTGAARGTFMLDDTTVIYATTAGELKRVAITGGTPTTLVTSGFATQGGFFSPDKKTMLFLKPGSGASHDLALVALDAPSTPVVLAGTTTSVGETTVQYFTSDSTRIMFPGDLSVPVHELYAAPISGAPIKTLATQSGGARWPVGGAKIVFADDFVPGDATTLGYATLKTIDLAGTGAAVTIASNAGPLSVPSANRASLVYTAIGASGTKADSAVYVTPIP